MVRRVGLNLGTVNPSLWLPLAELADRVGIESVWLPEHLVLPVTMSGSPAHGEEHPPIPSSVPVFDTFVFMGLMAGRTSNVRFGTNVYNIGLRHPFVTARSVATLDYLSGGRVDLGVGSSWMVQEWEATQLDFHTRGARVNEAIEICQRLWTEPVVEHHGRFYDFQPVMFEPKPAQAGGPPIHVGGDAPASMRRAAKYGKGWMPLNHSLDQIPAAAKALAQMVEEEGRTDHIELSLSVQVADDSDFDRYAELGIDRLLINPWTSSKNALASTEQFAEKYLR
ncbi:MAG: luciferase [Acidimicrobiia bacterium]|nr:luciferase [Acidimicrobiia bacterium]